MVITVQYHGRPRFGCRTRCHFCPRPEELVSPRLSRRANGRHHEEDRCQRGHGHRCSLLTIPASRRLRHGAHRGHYRQHHTIPKETHVDEPSESGRGAEVQPTHARDGRFAASAEATRTHNHCTRGSKCQFSRVPTRTRPTPPSNATPRTVAIHGSDTGLSWPGMY